MYNPFAGFDASGHIDYIHYVANHHALPLASMGWEMYQPPLYYLIASLLPSLAAVQALGFAAWVVITFMVWKVVRRPMIVLWTATIPVLLYLLPMVSNELFSGALITLSLGMYALNKRDWRLGVVLGLALLSKATALVALAAIGIDYVLRHKRIPWTILIPALLIGGWFYGRNLVLFHNPFVSSVDFPHYAFWQPPGYRDWRFFTDLSPFWRLDLFKAQWYSLWGGTYFTFFYDGHNGVVPIQAFSKAGIAIVLLSYPLFGLQIWGVVRKLKKPDPIRRFFILYTLLLWGAYIAYNIKLPFYSTVKGAFLVSLILPAAYFLKLGYESLPLRGRKVTSLGIVVLAAITVRHLWFF